jgi:hypothetical protein
MDTTRGGNGGGGPRPSRSVPTRVPEGDSVTGEPAELDVGAAVDANALDGTTLVLPAIPRFLPDPGLLRGPPGVALG